ncbi:MAG: prepilin-type N-terminal cleavage/methylation domain-containing protein [Alphaproteobacteria bacterium]|nr:prepilin-type N-terminal cleavage/methylation domain-containing protein [Alphaproteobacteria bacterium]
MKKLNRAFSLIELSIVILIIGIIIAGVTAATSVASKMRLVLQMQCQVNHFTATSPKLLSIIVH